MKGVSFVLLCYKSESFLKAAIDSIFRSTQIRASEFEIIVVDNWGDGAEAEIVSSYYAGGIHNIRYIKAPSNGGYGAGNNIGIRAAKFDVVAIVNPDVELVSPVTYAICREFELDSKLLALSGAEVTGVGIDRFFRPEYQLPFLMDVSSRIVRHTNIFLPKRMALSGAFTFFSKHNFRNIGYFDEEIFLYGEEADVSRRAFLTGLTLRYSPDFLYLHSTETKDLRMPKQIFHVLRSAANYSRKYNIGCRGYFFAAIIRYFIKYLVAIAAGDRSAQRFNFDVCRSAARYALRVKYV